jgi:hypothetical protein
MGDNLERLIPTSRPADRASLREPGIRPPAIPQAGYFPPLLGRELRRKVTLKNQPYCSRYTFPPTKASTLAQSSAFQVGSPIHALVSPR